jgi:hypothetical protein
VISVRSLLQEIGFNQSQPTVIYQHNNSCINIANSRKQQPVVKHIDQGYHFLRDRILSKEVLSRKSTHKMIADIFTKQLHYPAFSKHRTALRLSESSFSGQGAC